MSEAERAHARERQDPSVADRLNDAMAEFRDVDGATAVESANAFGLIVTYDPATSRFSLRDRDTGEEELANHSADILCSFVEGIVLGEQIERMRARRRTGPDARPNVARK
jgi:hypothetical protein